MLSVKRAAGVAVVAALVGALGASIAMTAGPAHGAIGGRVPAPLGSEAQCASYSGLPDGWRKEGHAGMVRVGSGSFLFGSDNGYPDERPASRQRTSVQGFWIDQTEVTLAQFAAFVAATGYVTEAERQGGAVVFHHPTDEELRQRPYAWWSFVRGADWRHPTGPGSDAAGLENRPVTLVTEADALAYAHWLGRDLPTEAEWEYAGKGGQEGRQLDTAPRDDGGKPLANYWQGMFPLQDIKADGHDSLAPVGCYAANPFKLYDMIGNAWEWTKDPYTGARQPHSNGDTAAVAAAYRSPSQPMVIKGGSFLCSPDYCVRYRASARESQERDLAAAHIGFRTVLRD
jgi:formylglycine-generating enzyme required for sulfatase activity